MHINLWTGVGMVVLAALFAVWVWRPLRTQDAQPSDDAALREMSRGDG